jgi:hypothetical protein
VVHQSVDEVCGEICGTLMSSSRQVSRRCGNYLIFKSCVECSLGVGRDLLILGELDGKAVVKELYYAIKGEEWSRNIPYIK